MRLVFLFSAVLLTVSCGGGGGITAGGSGGSTTGTGALQGPVVIDFEDRPNDGFTPLTLPVVLAPGIAVTTKTGSGELYDFSSEDGWSIGEPGCDAQARSGRMMIGLDCDRGQERSFDITFDAPVARVRLYAAGLEGELIWIEAYDALGYLLHRDCKVSTCPSLEENDALDIEYPENVIRTVRVHGCYPVIDDLTYWRFE